MVASLNMLAATYGRSHKEAQTYASYITMLVNFVPILPLLPDGPRRALAAARSGARHSRRC